MKEFLQLFCSISHLTDSGPEQLITSTYFFLSSEFDYFRFLTAKTHHFLKCSLTFISKNFLCRKKTHGCQFAAAPFTGVDRACFVVHLFELLLSLVGKFTR